MDWLYPLSGFVVGALVGLTGMGGLLFQPRDLCSPDKGLLQPVYS